MKKDYRKIARMIRKAGFRVVWIDTDHNDPPVPLPCPLQELELWQNATGKNKKIGVRISKDEIGLWHIVYYLSSGLMEWYCSYYDDPGVVEFQDLDYWGQVAEEKQRELDDLRKRCNVLNLVDIPYDVVEDTIYLCEIKQFLN